MVGSLACSEPVPGETPLTDPHFLLPWIKASAEQMQCNGQKLSGEAPKDTEPPPLPGSDPAAMQATAWFLSGYA